MAKNKKGKKAADVLKLTETQQRQLAEMLQKYIDVELAGARKAHESSVKRIKKGEIESMQAAVYVAETLDALDDTYNGVGRLMDSQNFLDYLDRTGQMETAPDETEPVPFM